MAMRLFRAVKSASKVVKTAYEAGKSMIQAVQTVRRTMLDSIFIVGAFQEGKEAVRPSDTIGQSLIYCKSTCNLSAGLKEMWYILTKQNYRVDVFP